MKITGPGGPAAPTAPRRPASAAVGGFSAAQTGASSPTAAAARPAGPSGVSSLDALLALQDVDGPGERRRRSVRRADRILDRLDALKLDLLGGGVTAGALGGLMEAVRDGRAATDDPGLEGVLDAVELRAAVELAKFEQARSA